MPEKPLNQALSELLNKLLKEYKPVFGRLEDIEINTYLKKLEKKSLKEDQRNSTMTKIIYKLKKLGYGN